MQPPPYDQAIAGPSKPPRKVGACVGCFDGMYRRVRGSGYGWLGWLALFLSCQAAGQPPPHHQPMPHLTIYTLESPCTQGADGGSVTPPRPVSTAEVKLFQNATVRFYYDFWGWLYGCACACVCDGRFCDTTIKPLHRPTKIQQKQQERRRIEDMADLYSIIKVRSFFWGAMEREGKRHHQGKEFFWGAMEREGKELLSASSR